MTDENTEDELLGFGAIGIGGMSRGGGLFFYIEMDGGPRVAGFGCGSSSC